MATAPGTAPTKRSGLLWKLATVPGEQSIKRPLSALRTAGTAARFPGGLASANPAVSKLLRGHREIHQGCSTATGSGRSGEPGDSTGPGERRASYAACTGGRGTSYRANARPCGVGS